MIHDIDNERRRGETNMSNLNRLMEKYKADDKSVQHKLKAAYKTCLNDASQEESIIREALDKIIDIRNIRNERRIQVSFDTLI